MSEQPDIKKDRATSAAEKGVAMIAWFEGRALPTLPVKLNKCTTLVNARKYVDTQVAILKTYKPLQLCWNAAYMRLYDLKQFLSK